LARTVLLADDSVTAQNMGRRILIDAGYEVITVNNGSAALKKIHESRPDLIVLDVYMPGYGGLEVCQRLKESSETNKIPVLLTVGKMEPFKSEEARRVRADGHIVKPFEASELLAALTKLEDRIVPQAEPARGRKGKSEKRARAWQVADPAVSFDDTHSDKIAYLAQVKQRHTGSEAGENPSEDRETVAAVDTAAETPSVSNSPDPAARTSSVPDGEGPRMPRPMSVYAAEALREHPEGEEPASAPVQVNAAAPPPPQEFAVQEGDGFAQSDSVESDGAGFESASVRNEEAPAEAPVENTPSAVVEDAPAEESSLAPAPSEPAAVSVDDDSEAESSPQGSEATTEPPQSAAAPSRWVAENVALTAEEASLELEREMTKMQAVSAAPAEPPAGPALETQSEAPVPAESPALVSEETNGATFAAAAAASSSSAIAASSAESEPEPPVASEASAAWQNWQHIRDSVMGSQTAVSLSESVAEVVQKSVTESVAQVTASGDSTDAPPNSETSADGDRENAELSSIVDSVLADLKPRLMAEISKKLKK
jgi:CheY-like chemotaxis protein